MMFWALTRLGDEPGLELRGLFEAQCGRQLRLLKPQELSMVASAYGRVERVAPLLAAVRTRRPVYGVASARWADAGCEMIAVAPAH